MAESRDKPIDLDMIRINFNILGLLWVECVYYWTGEGGERWVTYGIGGGAPPLVRWCDCSVYYLMSARRRAGREAKEEGRLVRG